MRACDPARRAFKKQFPARKARITDVVEWLKSPKLNEEHPGHDWQAWILGQNIEIAGAFLKAGANINSNCASAIGYAARNGDAELINYLIGKGINIRLYDDSTGDTLLATACENYETEVVKVLLATNHYSDEQVEDALEYTFDEELENLLQDYLDERSESAKQTTEP